MLYLGLSASILEECTQGPFAPGPELYAEVLVFGCPGDHLLDFSHTPAVIRSSFVARDSQASYNHLTASRLLRTGDDSVSWHGKKVSPLPTLAFRGRAIGMKPSSERPKGLILRGNPSDFANKSNQIAM